MENTPKLRLIDLFSGAGGMTQGFVQSSPGSYQCVWANDNNEFAAETYCANFGDHLAPGGLAELLADKALQIPPADVVIGGPPCQGFSLLNKQRAGDDRRQLWRPFLEADRQSPEHDRTIPDSVRRGVLRREDYKRTSCRWRYEEWNPSDPRHLELHHVKPHVNRHSRYRGF